MFWAVQEKHRAAKNDIDVAAVCLTWGAEHTAALFVMQVIVNLIQTNKRLVLHVGKYSTVQQWEVKYYLARPSWLRLIK